MARPGAPHSKDTLLRSLKRGVNKQAPAAPVHVVGVDDWSWRKGSTYETIMVDLKRREVLDVLPDRSAKSTASWLARRPAIEIVSRDRCDLYLYAQGTAEGAPQASQVADRFHLLQNRRHAIEQQLNRAPSRQLQLGPQEIVVLQEPPGLIHRYGQLEVTEHRHLVQAGRRAVEIIKRSDAAQRFEVLPRRWVVEPTFALLGRCRRLAKDFETNVASSTAWRLIARVRRLTCTLARF